MEGAVPIEAANARVAVLDVLAFRQRLIAEQQCLIRIAEKPKIPGGIGATGRSQVNAVVISKALALSLVAGAITGNRLLKVHPGIRKFGKMNTANPDRTVSGNQSGGVLWLCSTKDLLGGDLGIWVP